MSCFICHNSTLTPNGVYNACTNCGHEVLASRTATGNVVNDELDFARLSQADGLVKAQVALAARVAPHTNAVVDIGCGSGRFLYHARNAFKARRGVEVDAESKQFATTQFNLDVQESVAAHTLNDVGIVTFWHSFEHIPTDAINGILHTLHQQLPNDAVLLLSVPNAASWQHRWLGQRYAYYDVPAHLHQFTPQSLDLIMAAHGFTRRANHLIPSYLAFGWVQGLMNMVFPIHNYFYYRMKRGRAYALPAATRKRFDIINYLLLPFALGVGAVLTLAELLVTQRRGVITASYGKTGAR